MSSLLDRRLTPSYNCAHYAAEVWSAETGEDIEQALAGFLSGRRGRSAQVGLRHSFERLAGPQSPCIVLFRRARVAPHVGVFARGRVRHLTSSGPIRQLVDVARLGYTSVRYYAPRPSVL